MARNNVAELRPGPHNPLAATPAPAPRSMRRTWSIDITFPEGLEAGVVADVRGRDLRTDADGKPDVVDELAVALEIDPATGTIVTVDATRASAPLDALHGACIRERFRTSARRALRGRHRASLIAFQRARRPRRRAARVRLRAPAGGDHSTDARIRRRRGRAAKPTCASVGRPTGPTSRPPGFEGTSRCRSDRSHPTSESGERHGWHDDGAVDPSDGAPAAAPRRPRSARRRWTASAGALPRFVRGRDRRDGHARVPRRRRVRRQRSSHLDRRRSARPAVAGVSRRGSRRSATRRVSTSTTSPRAYAVSSSDATTCTHLNSTLRTLADVVRSRLAPAERSRPSRILAGSVVVTKHSVHTWEMTERTESYGAGLAELMNPELARNPQPIYSMLLDELADAPRRRRRRHRPLTRRSATRCSATRTCSRRTCRRTTSRRSDR